VFVPEIANYERVTMTQLVETLCPAKRNASPRRATAASRNRGREPARGIHGMSRWAEDLLGPSGSRYCRDPDQVWAPAVNVCEHETHYCVTVELSGMSGSEIDLRVERGVLVVSGSRPAPEPPPEHRERSDGPKSLHLMEINHGAFHRALELPPDVDVDAIEATYRTGYLWVRLPKKQ